MSRVINRKEEKKIIFFLYVERILNTNHSYKPKNNTKFTWKVSNKIKAS